MDYKIEPTYKISFKYRRVMVPFDGSGPSVNALELALDWSLRYGSLITVVIATPLSNGDTAHIERLVEKARATASKYGKTIDLKILEYDPIRSSAASTIVKEVLEGGYDAVIVGARGTTPLEDINLGSIALSLIHNTPVTIVVIR